MGCVVFALWANYTLEPLFFPCNCLDGCGVTNVSFWCSFCFCHCWQNESSSIAATKEWRAVPLIAFFIWWTTAIEKNCLNQHENIRHILPATNVLNWIMHYIRWGRYSSRIKRWYWLFLRSERCCWAVFAPAGLSLRIYSYRHFSFKGQRETALRRCGKHRIS